MGTLVALVNALEPACAPFAFSRNATIDAYVSAERPFGFSGGIDVRMRVNNSWVV